MLRISNHPLKFFSRTSLLTLHHLYNLLTCCKSQVPKPIGLGVYRVSMSKLSVSLFFTVFLCSVRVTTN